MATATRQDGKARRKNSKGSRGGAECPCPCEPEGCFVRPVFCDTGKVIPGVVVACPEAITYFRWLNQCAYVSPSDTTLPGIPPGNREISPSDSFDSCQDCKDAPPPPPPGPTGVNNCACSTCSEFGFTLDLFWGIWSYGNPIPPPPDCQCDCVHDNSGGGASVTYDPVDGYSYSISYSPASSPGISISQPQPSEDCVFQVREGICCGSWLASIRCELCDIAFQGITGLDCGPRGSTCYGDCVAYTGFNGFAACDFNSGLPGEPDIYTQVAYTVFYSQVRCWDGFACVPGNINGKGVCA